MQVLMINPPVPTYSLEPDELTGSNQFRVYTYDGGFPDRSELLIPHRKDYYLLVFIRHAGTRQWIDMAPYVLKDNTVYFTGPGQVIVKEEFDQLWSTGIAFTAEFLASYDDETLSRLPLIQQFWNGPELLLAEADVCFVDDIVNKISQEYQQPGKWQQRMLRAYLTVLLTYLSRLCANQYPTDNSLTDKLLLRAFQAKIDACFREQHEVKAYASMLNISAGHLSEVVKDQSGRPAIKHIHERLVLEARRLLFHSTTSLKEIAYDLGFSDASYFTRFFKRETGATPAHYRNHVRKMYQ